MRKEITVTITEVGSRDLGKQFFIREMPAAQAEEWGIRALFALARSGIDIGQVVGARQMIGSDDDNIRRAGMAGLYSLGFQALLNVNFVEAKPLLDEMFQCISLIPDPAHPEIKIVPPLVDDQIEEVTTRLLLRREVLDLHLGFLKAVANSQSNTTTTAVHPLSNTPTSHHSSHRSSHAAKRR